MRQRLDDALLTIFGGAWATWRAITLIVIVGLTVTALIGWLTEGEEWLAGVAISGALLWFWFHPDD